MSVDLASIKKSIRHRLRSSGEDFDEVFYLSVNDVIRDIQLDTAAEIDEIDTEDPPDELDLESYFTPAIINGVEYYMQLNARWARRTEEQVTDAVYRRSLYHAQTRVLVDGVEDGTIDAGWDYDDD